MTSRPGNERWRLALAALSGFLCVLGYLSVCAVMAWYFSPYGPDSFKHGSPMFVIPIGLGFTSFALQGLRPSGSRSWLVVALAGLLVVSPIWATGIPELIACVVGQFGIVRCSTHIF